MTTRLSLARNIFVRALPALASILLASIHPAFAANGGGGAGNLQAVQTGSNQTQAAMLGVAFAGCVIGIGLGAWHYIQHRDDWVGASGRLIAGIVGGVVVSQAVPLASMAGGALF